jgi:NAD-reducing hydrogenase large subunit
LDHPFTSRERRPLGYPAGLYRVGPLARLNVCSRSVTYRNAYRGVGCCEAPRGTLFHDYQVERGGTLTRVEAGIRAYDPCLSCSTHAAGRMPMTVELRGPAGELLDSAGR